MSRDPEAIIHEADYWQAALADITRINEAILAASTALVEGPIALLGMVAAPSHLQSAEPIREAFADALRAVGTMQEPLQNLIDLAGGRILSLRREAGLEEGGEA